MTTVARKSATSYQGTRSSGAEFVAGWGEGDKVKVTCRFRGREITHPEMAERQLRLVVERCGAQASVEAEPKMEGRTMTLLLAPPKSGGGAKPRPRIPAPGEAPGDAGTSAPMPRREPPGPAVERR